MSTPPPPPELPTQLMLLLRSDGSAQIVQVNVHTPKSPISLRTTLGCEETEHTTLHGGDDGAQLGLFSDDTGRIDHKPLNRAATKILHALKWKTHRIYNQEEAIALTVFGHALLYDDNRDMTPELYDTLRKIVRARHSMTAAAAHAAAKAARSS